MYIERYTPKFQELLHTPSIPYREQTVNIYQRAFAGFPWYEDLSVEEIAKRIEADFVKPGFEGVWAINDKDHVIGASWYYPIDPDYLGQKRGEQLKAFAENKIRENNSMQLVWQSMTVVDPDFQGRGVGIYLKDQIDEMLHHKASVDARPILYLTRIRDDNTGSIRMNEVHEMQRTGISTPSSQVAGLSHHYWYKIIYPKS
ncbi:GNAT family N-acetyltransferase [Candidatus Microgenomates bacterium]|nr:MAG: GNAT family N-acetyltransferase [Candidatus Microgenomates bacterium]